MATALQRVRQEQRLASRHVVTMYEGWPHPASWLRLSEEVAVCSNRRYNALQAGFIEGNTLGYADSSHVTGGYLG
jgi:hypothetical protein